MYETVPASVAHIPDLVRDARQADIEECWAAGAIPFSTALEFSIAVSEWSKTWLVNGVPAAMGGICVGGLVWILGTNLVDRHARAFLAQTNKEFLDVKAMHPILFNFVDVRNRRAVRWIKWLGFEMQGPIPYGPFKKPFYRFEWRRKP